jgi:hypothetical protein
MAIAEALVERLATDTAAKAQAAKMRLARAEKGEDVGSIGPSLTRKDMLRISGMSEAVLWYCEQFGETANVCGFERTAEGLQRIVQLMRMLGEERSHVLELVK